MATNSNKSGFCLNRLLQLFKSCRNEEGDIIIDKYNDAYDELCKLFYLLGKVFSFVASDVEEKVGILRDYCKCANEGEHYKTIQSMVTYEVDKKITDNPKKASGCRTLLRLHRALEFTYEFMEEICKAEKNGKMSKAASEAYGRSLAKFHPFLIRQAVYLAVHTLPYRDQLMKDMHIQDIEEGKKILQQIISEQREVYNITQSLYEQNNLLKLP